MTLSTKFNENFKLDTANKKICAFNNNDQFASVGSKASLTAAVLPFVKSIGIEAAEAINFVSISDITSVTANVGTTTSKFEIKVSKEPSTSANEFALKSADGLELINAQGENVELKSKKEGDSALFFFDIPKNAEVEKHYYTLRSLANHNVKAKITVDVQEAKLVSLAFKTTMGTNVSEILPANAQLMLKLEGTLSNGDKIDILNAKSGYTVTAPNGLSITENKSVQFTVPTVPEEKFSPQKLQFTVTKNNVSVPVPEIKYYINNKPQITASSIKFNRTVDGNVATSNTLPIGGEIEGTDAQRNLHCLKLAEAKFTLGNTSGSDVGTAVELSKLNIIFPENQQENFVRHGNYVCATKKAPFATKVNVIIQSTEDASVTAEHSLDVINAYKTSNIALVDQYNQQSADYAVVLSEATPTRILSFKYINSDDSIDTKTIVPADSVIVSTKPANSSYFEAKKVGDGENATWQVVIKNGALVTLNQLSVVSQEVVITNSGSNPIKLNNTIPLSFSKN